MQIVTAVPVTNRSQEFVALAGPSRYLLEWIYRELPSNDFTIYVAIHIQDRFDRFKRELNCVFPTLSHYSYLNDCFKSCDTEECMGNDLRSHVLSN